VIARALLPCLLALACTRENPPGASSPNPAPSRAVQAPGSARTAELDRAVTSPSAAPSVSLTGGEWTAGIVDQKAPGARVALLRAVRAARHEGLDRVVFEFEGAGLPGYHLEYIDRPVRRCGSGDVAELLGDAWLQIAFEPAAAHTEAGKALLEAREQRPALPIVREVELTCDFEAQVSVVLGVASPNRFRVLELASPTRLVVDVRHR